jgi:hypothetical protein
MIYRDRWPPSDYHIELWFDCQLAGFPTFYVPLAETALPRRVILERLQTALRTVQ